MSSSRKPKMASTPPAIEAGFELRVCESCDRHVVRPCREKPYLEILCSCGGCEFALYDLLAVKRRNVRSGL